MVYVSKISGISEQRKPAHKKHFYIFIRYLFFTPCVAYWLQWLHSQHLMSTGRQVFCYRVNWVTDKHLAHKVIMYFIVDKD